MNEKIVDLITKLADTGSTTALWFYGLYVFGTIAKFIVGFGCSVIGIKIFCNTWKKVNDAK